MHLGSRTKVFVVISKVTKVAMHMLPKLDDNGDPMPTKTKRPNGRMIKEEKKSIETFQEYYIEDMDAIKYIIKLMCINSEEFDITPCCSSLNVSVGRKLSMIL